MVRDLPDEHFATAFLALFHPETGRMTYANAGHPAAFLQRAGADKTRELGLTGPLLGVMPDVSYESIDVDLPPGSHLFVYTDGLSETQNSDGELWGDDHVVSHLNRFTPSSELSLFVSDVLERVNAFRGRGPTTDDVTVVLARFDPT
jgi:serine phosphatase RsbU (regulator of sigma subunit)